MKFIKNILNTIFFFMTFLSYSQEHKVNEHEEINHHSISFLISHTIITEGIENNEKTLVSVPSWAINYNYSFNEKWAIGLHNDIIIEDFVIEKNKDEEIIERSTPIASIIVGTYKIIEGFGIELGVGMEFEKSENFGVARIGAEYGIEIPNKKLEVLFAIDYDILFDAYNSFNLGIGIAKLF